MLRFDYGEEKTRPESLAFANFSQITVWQQRTPAKINTKRESQAVAEQNAKELETAAG